MTKRMRKQHWVDSSVQGTLIRRMLLHWSAFFGVTLLCVSLMQVLLGDPKLTIMERVSVPDQSFMLLALIMLAMLPLFILDTIRFSNRFVGPIARLRRHMRELGNGERVPTLVFRDSDFWTEVADEFNQISNIVSEQRKEIETLKQQASETAGTPTAS